MDMKKIRESLERLLESGKISKEEYKVAVEKLGTEE